MAKPSPFDICKLLNTNAVESHDPISGVAVDSRDVQPGQLFVALKGQQTDGHSFVDEAFKKGAQAALVSESYPGQDPRLIKVKDPLTALQEIARWHVGKTNAQVIAVTGSLGKTTTKEFLYTILKSKYKTACTMGNQNSQVGMAVSLINNVVGNEEYIVVEMGMTHPGNIKQLTSIIVPHKAIITSIALVHAENFDSIEGIAAAKAEVFSNPKTQLVLFNADSECLRFLQNRATCKTKTFSLADRKANFMLEVHEDGLTFFNHHVKVKLPYVALAAPHVYSNLLAACAMATCCYMSSSEIAASLEHIKMPEKRLEQVTKAGICFINDSYNAAEPSLKAALSYVKGLNGFKRKVAVIGQMRELGRFSEECHKRVAEHALDCVDTIYCLGQECAPIVSVCQKANKACSHFLDFTELSKVLQKDLQKDDLVLLKGSRSNGLWRVLDLFT